MNADNLCPTCHFQNDQDALMCAKCNTPLPLAGRTITLSNTTISNKTTSNTVTPYTIINDDSHSETLTSSDPMSDAMAHFKITDILGQGGMGAVYRAQDLTLQRSVALKLFSSSQSSSGGEAQSLLDEARLACKLNHPNIVTIYDVARGLESDSDDGEEASDKSKSSQNSKNSQNEKNQNSFIVMEWVDGQTLNKLIPEQGFSAVKALEYACQIADGLVCAHQQSIIHRDIKPHNLMVNKDGNIKILDFGIACLQQKQNLTNNVNDNVYDEVNDIANDSVKSIGSASLINPANITGTPQYMAPEQIKNGITDVRTDIFAFGVVLYEMLTGERPFQGRTLEELQSKIINGQFTPVEQVNAQANTQKNGSTHNPTFHQTNDSTNKSTLHQTNKLVPAELAHIVTKMLDIDAQARWQTSAQLKDELDSLFTQLTLKKNWWQRRHWLSKTAIILPFLLLMGWSTTSVLFPPSTQELVQRQVAEASKVALLPFDNISGDPLLQIFVDGLSISLNSDLTTAGYEQGDGTTWVIPSSEVRKLENPTAQSLRDKFGVVLVITGSVQHFGSTRSVVLNLLNAQDGRQLKTVELSIDANQLFEGEHAVREQVLKLLDWQISEQTLAQFNARQPKFDGAYKHYIEGQGYLYRLDLAGNLDKAERAFESAIAIDPSYENAFVGLAEVQLTRYKRSTSEVLWLERMQATLNQLFSVAPNNIDINYLHAELLMQRGEYQLAIEMYLPLIDRNIHVVRALVGAAKAYERLDKNEQARLALARARLIEPNNWILTANIGLFYFQNEMYKESLYEFEELIKKTPDNHYGYQYAAVINYLLGNVHKAIKYTKRSIEISPSAGAYSNLGTLLFHSQSFVEAKIAFEKAVDMNSENYLYWGNLADSYKVLSDDKAESSYRKALSMVELRLETNPNDSKAISRAAYYNACIGNDVRAIELASKIGQTNTGSENFNIATAYDQLGNIQKAIEHLTIALAKKYPVAEAEISPLLRNTRLSGFFDNL